MAVPHHHIPSPFTHRVPMMGGYRSGLQMKLITHSFNSGFCTLFGNQMNSYETLHAKETEQKDCARDELRKQSPNP